ncbi:MAG: MMPL family transporter [Alphaproteobacteria bacterium]|nr:MMPL family transporter [Alphaproteobacteria bacterium]
MFTTFIVRIVDFSRRMAVPVVLLALIASIVLGGYVATHFKINTDVNQLLSADLEWRKREVALEKAFPQNVDQLVIVIDGANADDAERAASELAAKMRAQPDVFKTVVRPDAIPFFKKNGLLFLSEKELSGILDILIQAQPLLGTLARDPSLRGLFGTLDLVLEGLKRGEVEYKYLDKPFSLMADTIEAALAGQDKPLPWRSLMSDHTPNPHELRKFILTQPVLDYGALEPGAKASDAVRTMAREMNLTPDHGVRVRLTGSVALNDEEFASVAEGTTVATVMSIVLVFVILFLALRSFRLIWPILLTLAAGLIATTAFAMASIGSLNLISVAFAVMFVGIAVDFGIQFGVRYRDQHHQEPDGTKALLATARIIALPLALAAGSTAVGFLAFTPTAYSGVAELGLIAGVGMIIAYLLTITLLPALLSLFKPPAEPEAIGYAWAAPLDTFLIAHRPVLLKGALLLAVAGLLIASQLRFDFDPLNLKDPHTESVQTLFDFMKSKETNPYAIQILEPSLAEAEAAAKRIGALPEVDYTMTLASFVPEDQDKKLAMIADANFLLAPTLNPPDVLAKPTDEENFVALNKAATGLHEIGKQHPSAERLATALDTVVKSHDPALLQRLHTALISGMVAQLNTVRESLNAQHVALTDITDDLRRDWLTPDGRALLKVYPKDFPENGVRDPRKLTAFTDAVASIAPDISGAPVSIQESGKTIVNAFIKAGIFGVLAIALLSWLVLRRATDVARLIAPLILAGILTLATMVIVHLPLNFANIIALPLLLSLGVSYAIYFVSAWRDGLSAPLQSSMARAVLFSAATTTVAFGSLSLSTHPGTSSMGKLLTVALLYCVLCTFLVLPALLGKPDLSRKKETRF